MCSSNAQQGLGGSEAWLRTVIAQLVDDARRPAGDAAAAGACAPAVDAVPADLPDPAGGTDDAEDVLTALDVLERLKATAAAAQARLMVGFDTDQRARQRAEGLPTRRLGQGVAEQIALARRISPSRASRSLAAAKVLVEDMPHTLDALATGEISEFQADLVIAGTRVLETEDRILADLDLAGRLGPLGDRQVDAEVRTVAYRLDPQAVVNAKVRAERDRRVTVRPAPDCMEYVTGLVPMAAGIAVYKALREHAQARRAAGDTRTLDQIQADTFIERLTGQADADAVPVAVTVVMTGSTLFDPGQGPAAGQDDIADVEGYGPVPGAVARDLLAAMPDDVALRVRRLFTDPVTGQAQAGDGRSRTFTGAVREFVTRRDRFCSTPYCGAPIRHVDHVTDHADGGPTTAENGRGTCERCNYAKQAPGWRTRVVPPESGEAGRVIEISTPTGRRYRSSPPRQPGHHPPDRPPLRARPA